MRGKAKINHLIVHLILLAGTIIVVFPFLWMILTSFKTNGEAMQIPPTILPTEWVTDAYQEILTAIPFATVYMNTIISAVVTTAVQVAFCELNSLSRTLFSFLFFQYLWFRDRSS